MPRKLDKKLIQGRVKENKALMREHKTVLTVEMKNASQGADVDKKRARDSLNLFMRAALAVTADNAKLETLKEGEEGSYHA